MTFIFVTAIRIAPEHWVAWRRHIAEMFAQGRRVDGFTCQDGDRVDVMIEDAVQRDPAHIDPDAFATLLAAPRSQDIYHRSLEPLEPDGQGSAHLVVLKTGEVCRIDVLDLAAPSTGDASDIIVRHGDILSEIRASLRVDTARLVPFLPEGLAVDRLS
jgi:hypothetical protein